MEQFEAYFRRADLHHDGRIDEAEAVPFFQGSNLPQQVIDQVHSFFFFFLELVKFGFCVSSCLIEEY